MYCQLNSLQQQIQMDYLNNNCDDKSSTNSFPMSSKLSSAYVSEDENEEEDDCIEKVQGDCNYGNSGNSINLFSNSKNHSIECFLFFDNNLTVKAKTEILAHYGKFYIASIHRKSL